MQNPAVVAPACRSYRPPGPPGALPAADRGDSRSTEDDPARRRGTFASPVDNFLRQPSGFS
jgi:hypothetical protein